MSTTGKVTETGSPLMTASWGCGGQGLEATPKGAQGFFLG
jgi:hypothetical protein